MASDRIWNQGLDKYIRDLAAYRLEKGDDSLLIIPRGHKEFGKSSGWLAKWRSILNEDDDRAKKIKERLDVSSLDEFVERKKNSFQDNLDRYIEDLKKYRDEENNQILLNIPRSHAKYQKSAEWLDRQRHKLEDSSAMARQLCKRLSQVSLFPIESLDVLKKEGSSLIGRTVIALQLMHISLGKLKSTQSVFRLTSLSAIENKDIERVRTLADQYEVYKKGFWQRAVMDGLYKNRKALVQARA